MRRALSYKIDWIDLVVYLPFAILILLFIFNLLIFWPGQMTSDSILQYNEALGSLTNIHPPIMALLWRFFSNFISGSGSVFLFHLLLLYSACAIFIVALKEYRIKWFYVFMPLCPSILFYSSMIWKDVGFAFSYLFVASVITLCIKEKRQLNFFQLFLLLMILFYGTAVKFQAMYLAPIFMLGLYSLSGFKLTVKRIFILLPIFYIVSIFTVTKFNNLLVPQDTSNRWRFVKIYDLAGISLDQNKPIFPSYILTYKNFSMQLLREKFNYERVDDIAFFEDSPIPSDASNYELHDLFATWLYAVIKHPISYLKHRFNNWKTIIFAKPLEKLDKLDFSKYKGLVWFAKIQQAKENTGKLVFGFLSIARYFFSFIFLFILLIISLFIGILKFKNRLAFPLLIMVCSALLLVFILFFLSMASNMRYVYMSVCMIYASLPLAYLTLKR